MVPDYVLRAFAQAKPDELGFVGKALPLSDTRFIPVAMSVQPSGTMCGSPGIDLTPQDVQALAAEALTARSRCCGDCRFYGFDRGLDAMVCHQLPRTGPDGDMPIIVKPNWFCADFTSRETQA